VLFFYGDFYMNFTDIRKDFPIFTSKRAKKYIYFDNAATTQKPQCVIDKISNFYAYHSANVFRSIYSQSEEVTGLYEQARAQIANFIGATSCEIIFTSGATDGINFITSTWGATFVKQGDEIIVSQMEHHSNFLPWQKLAETVGAKLKIIPMTENYLLDMNAYKKMLSPKTKIVSVTHISNVLGTTNDVKKITQLAHDVGARVLIDAAQSAPHVKLDVNDLGADFLVFSGHKMLGPTGIGILYIKKELHDFIDPYQFGGGMVAEVCREKSYWKDAPYKFEAGTPPIAQAIGLAEAVNYLNKNIDFNKLRVHEAMLVSRMIEGLETIPGIRIIGSVEQLKKEGHLVSFIVESMHAHDVATLLDVDDIAVAVRAGQQCAQPLHALLGLPATLRASFYCYNTLEEVDSFIGKMKLLFKKIIT